MKYQGLSFPLFAMLSLLVVFLNSSHSGGNLTGACNSCHGGNTSANGSILLTGLPNSGAVVANTTYTMQLCIVDPGKLAAGFRVETDLGTFATLDASTQTNAANDRIGHTFPRSFGSPGNPACWDFDWTSPASAPTEPSFTLRGNAVNANGSTTGDNGGYIETSQGLPVEFASFDLKKQEGYVEVFWSTASEINNDKFIVQRSRDNVRFTNLASIEGNENSMHLHTYQYRDDSAPSTTLYYRILQVDNDGSTDYSTTKVVDNSDPLIQWSVYPNPIDLNHRSAIKVTNRSADLILMDRSGKIMKTYPQSSQSDELQIDDHIPTGIYYLTDGDYTVPISVLR